MKKKCLSRRSFLKAGTGASFAATLTPAIVSLAASKASANPSPMNKWPGRVVINYNNTHSASQINATGASATTLTTMVDDAIKMLTNETTVGAAWKAIFPATLTASSKIAIKINLLSSGVVPGHPFIVKGIVEGLMLMDFGGSTLTRSNITIYDANNSDCFNAKGYNTTNFPGITLVPTDTLAAHGSHHNYANTLFNADFLINIPGLRGHGSEWGNATLGFKSHLGTFPAGDAHSNPVTHLRDYNCVGPVYDKTVLTVCNAIFGTRYNNGPTSSSTPDNYGNYARALWDNTVPTTRVNADTIILSTDPVSAEYQMHKIMRYYYATPQATTVASMPDYLKAAAGIAVDGVSPIYDIGVLREDMRVGRIFNTANQGWTGTEGWVPAESAAEAGLHPKISAYPNPVNPVAHFDFWAPTSMAGQTARLEIFNAAGRLVHEKEAPVAGAWNHALWDGRNRNGRQAATGAYTVRIRVGRETLRTTFTLAR